MKPLCLLAVSLFFSASARLFGGPVSLKPSEVTALRALVATNTAAAHQFSSLHRTADAALNEAPNPIAKIVSEGHLRTDPLKIRTGESLPDLEKISAFGWTWAVTGDARYARQGRVFLLAWVTVNQPDGDAINETQLEPLIVGYDLLRTTFAETDRQQVDDWLRHHATVLWQDHRGLTDNWFSHRLKIVGLIGWTIGDPQLIAEAVNGYHQQINRNLRPDGASDDFYKRDALHYHLYDIEPLLTLARTAERGGQPLFNYQATNGATLQRAVDFVVPFANGSQTHIEFVNSKVAFDLKRAKHGEGEYAPHPWEPHTAIGLFSSAAWFHPEYGVLAATLAGHPGEVYFNWLMVMNAVSLHQP